LALKEQEAALVVLGVTKLTAGLRLLSAIRRAHPRARTLMLSPVVEALWANEALRAGADGFALKQSPAEELLRGVVTVLQGQTYVDPSLPESAASCDTRTSRLSSREDQVIRHFAAGQPAKMVAELLGISPRTLETYRARAMTKLGLRTRAELVRHALRSGWLPEP
jgi:DNA-binding NarL/FixJ family response regulator